MQIKLRTTTRTKIRVTEQGSRTRLEQERDSAMVKEPRAKINMTKAKTLAG